MFKKNSSVDPHLMGLIKKTRNCMANLTVLVEKLPTLSQPGLAEQGKRAEQEKLYGALKYSAVKLSTICQTVMELAVATYIQETRSKIPSDSVQSACLSIRSSSSG